MAAVLASGPGAVLSHRDAAALYGIRPSSRREIEVTVPRRRHPRPGIEPRLAALPADEITTHEGIPVTTVPRTLFDLAAVRGRREVERAFHEAEVRRLYDPLSLADLLARYPRRRGAATVRAILAARDAGAGMTRNDLEEAFLAFLARVGLPRPRVNHPLRVRGRWIEADCVWIEERLVVELDGRGAHATLEAFERDRARDRALAAAGWRVVRVTWRHLHDGADALAADLGALLGYGPAG
jgi:very-short-patch-repair endonuclease